MKKRILLQTFLIITFLLSMQITYAPSSKAPEIQNKSQLISDQGRPPSRIERRKKKKEEYLRKKARALGFKADSYNIQLVGMWPYGPCVASALDTNRNIAVIGNGKTLQVLDISTPSSPSKIGEVFLQAQPWAISISGNYAYVLTEDSLRVIDISILSSPREVGNADISYLGSYYGYALAVSSNYAYVVDEERLRIFDISNPNNPTEVGTYDDYANYAWIYEVAIWANYAFIINERWTGTEYLYELRIIDITNPSTPTLTGTYQGEVDYLFWSINAADTGYAYFVQQDTNTDTSKITIIDVATDPANPAEVGNYVESERWYEDLKVSGNYVYYLSWHYDVSQRYLEVINISNLSNPFYVGGSDAPSYMLDFSGSYVGIYGFGGFSLYDISDPSSPFQLGFYYTPDWAGDYGNSIAVSGDYAYMANYRDGLRIMDVSSPYNPSVAGICDTVYGQTSVVVSGDYAYGVDNSGLWIVDISSPSSPSQEGYLDMSWYTRDVFVSGSYAYVCGYQYVSDEARACLAIIDVSDPSSPSLTSSYVCPTRSYNYGGIALSGNYAYLGMRDYSTGSLKAGLKVIDISNPANPTERGTYVSYDSGYVYDVEVRGNYAYLAGYSFIIVDVSNPWSPSEISFCDNSSRGLAISGNYAYLGYLGLTLIDISDPHYPIEAGYYYNDLGDAVAVSGNYAYIPGSLYIFKNILAPEVSITSPSAWSDVGGSVSIEAQASHSSGIAQVEFYIDKLRQSIDSTSPYSYEWDTSSVTEGPHKIRVLAYNNNGKSSDFEIEVTVKPSWNLTISSTSGGTTDPEPGTYSYVVGTEVTITATPNSGYEFSNWSGAASGTANPITITMDADKSITANFGAIPSEETEAGDGDGKKIGCFIATAAYGSLFHPYLETLRDFRDKFLMPSKLGSKLVNLYYKYSPSVADLIAKHKVLRVVVRMNLLPLIGFSYSMLHFGPAVTIVIFGFIFALLIIMFALIKREIEVKRGRL